MITPLAYWPPPLPPRIHLPTKSTSRTQNTSSSCVTSPWRPPFRHGVLLPRGIITRSTSQLRLCSLKKRLQNISQSNEEGSNYGASRNEYRQNLWRRTDGLSGPARRVHQYRGGRIS